MNFCLKNKDAKIKEVLILAIYRKGNFLLTFYHLMVYIYR